MFEIHLAKSDILNKAASRCRLSVSGTVFENGLIVSGSLSVIPVIIEDASYCNS